jgi:hypothetical protein
MIQANELRIGNWFCNQKNQPQQVEFFTLEYLCNDNFSPHDAVNPILITPEILEKCGFDWDNYSGKFNLDIKGMGSIDCCNYLTDKTMLVYAGTDMDCAFTTQPILYLHQLQNLYFALTGEELNYQL